MDIHTIGRPVGSVGQDVARLYDLLGQMAEEQDYRWAESIRRLTALEKGEGNG